MWLGDDERMGPGAVRHLTDETNQVLLSAAVVWEVAIKRSLGKLDAPPDLVTTFLRAGVLPLPVTLDHAAAVERLVRHHRYPLDRLVVAQALAEDAVLVSGDAQLGRYGVSVVW